MTTARAVARRRKDLRRVASFGGAARAWLNKYDFVGMFNILEANMSCPHLSLFYR